MKKWMVTAAVAAVLLLQPFEPADAGGLYVVETLALEWTEAGVTVAAENLFGQGGTMEAALENMEEQTPGQLFLRQVKRVILCGDTGADALASLPEEIPMGAVVYTAQTQARDLARQEDLQEILEAREQREHNLPRLAEVLNHRLEQKSVEGR